MTILKQINILTYNILKVIIWLSEKKDYFQQLKKLKVNQSHLQHHLFTFGYILTVSSRTVSTSWYTVHAIMFAWTQPCSTRIFYSKFAIASRNFQQVQASVLHFCSKAPPSKTLTSVLISLSCSMSWQIFQKRNSINCALLGFLINMSANTRCWHGSQFKVEV